jgi:[ribosomal protein S18]-alanine N-acetyltransferase
VNVISLISLSPQFPRFFMIRPFEFSDLDRILQIERQSFPKSPYDWETFINLYYLYPETFLVCVDTTWGPGEILGYIIFSPDGHLISLAVHPGHRRNGIGRRLIEEVMGFPGIKRIRAEVRRSNRSAQAFYLGLEFRTVGVIPNYYGNEDALVVERSSVRLSEF